MILFILVNILSIIYALELPLYLKDHLDKSSPNYTTELHPWISSEVDLKANVSTLQLVIGFFRHGNRSPAESYKGDKYPFDVREYWPDGPKELTKVGKNQLYQLGKSLRKRYAGFLSENYLPEEVMVKSNTVGRTFMSAACLLAGLYPPQDYQLWNPRIKWQPIPIWEQPIDISKVTTNPKICPQFYKEMLEAVDAFNKYQAQHQNMLNYLNEHTGLNVTVLSDAYRFWEIFSLQDDFGYDLPEWVQPFYPEKLANIQATSMATLTSATPHITQLLTSPLITDIIKQIRNKMEGSKEKIHLEAVHETTINAILPIFGFKKPFIVAPSAILILELHQIENHYFVELFYFKNSTTAFPEKLLIESCTYSCPVEYILKTLDLLIIYDWKEKCKIIETY